MSPHPSQAQAHHHQQQQQALLPSWFIIKVTLWTSLGGCLFGYDMGAISGALPPMAQSLDFADNEPRQEWVVSILYLGGGLGACVGGTLCDVWGRKKSIIGTDMVFMLGALWLSHLAHSYGSVLVGRFIVGVAVAVSGIANVAYLQEMAPTEWRGAIVSVNEACISLGFLLAYVAGYAYAGNGNNANANNEDNDNDNDNEAWRRIFGWAGVLALIQVVGMWRMPESPVWLAEQGRLEESQEAWNMIQNGGRRRSRSIPTSNDGGNDNDHDHDETSFHQPLRTVSTPSSSSASASASSSSFIISNSQKQQNSHHDHPNPDDHDIVTTSFTYQSAQTPKPDEFHSFESLDQLNNVVEPLSTSSSLPSSTLSSCFKKKRNNHQWLAKVRETIRSILHTVRKYRRQSYIAFFLAATQQFCGQTSVLNYAPYIFAAQASGTDDPPPPAWSTLAIGGVKFVVTVLVIWRIEHVGRRTLLLLGMTCISVGMLALIVAFGGSSSSSSSSNDDDDDDNDDDGNPGADSMTTFANLKTFHLALPGVLLVVCGYSMSFGPLTWLLTAELFPTDIRGRALGASTILTYLCASLVTRTFLSASSAVGPAKVFGIYCIINTLGIVFAYLAIPDTGEKNVEQIEDALQTMWWWRYDYDAILLSSQQTRTMAMEEQEELTTHSSSSRNRSKDRSSDDYASSGNGATTSARTRGQNMIELLHSNSNGTDGSSLHDEPPTVLC